jgi:hypothetical protein
VISNMNNGFIELLKIYSSKVNYELSTFEEEQLQSLYSIYGEGATSLVLKCLKDFSIPAMARALMQVGGFCDSVPPSLKGLILTRTEAVQKYNKSQIEVSDKLRELVKILNDPSQKKFIDINNEQKTYQQLWQESSGQKIAESEKKRAQQSFIEVWRTSCNASNQSGYKAKYW